MKPNRFVPAAMLSSLIGCANVSAPEVIEQREYLVPKDNQIQLVASDLAVEMEVAGIEWNENLRPWDYRTLRSRSIFITDNNPQQAYIRLFKDTGLLTLYNEDMNRIFIEPFSTSIKNTTKFEPSFEAAAMQSSELNRVETNQLIEDGVVQSYPIYKGESVQQTITAWAKQAGFKTVIWNIDEQEQVNSVTRKHRSTSTVFERTPILAINALLENVNSHQSGMNIHYRVFPNENVFVLHGMGESEPLMLFKVDASDTKQNTQRLADLYGVELDYEAPKYKVKDSYMTVVSSRIEKSFQHVLAGYPMTVVHRPSQGTIKIGPKPNEK